MSFDPGGARLVTANAQRKNKPAPPQLSAAIETNSHLLPDLSSTMFADLLPRSWRRPARTSPVAPQIFVTAVSLSAARGPVFDLLADIEALPRWAPSFCERISLVEGRWLALTILGDVWCALDADGRTGVIDLRVERGRGWPPLLVPLRVVDLPGGNSVVSLTLVQAPGQSVREFARERIALRGALRGLGGRLDGLEAPCRRGWRPWLGELEKAPAMPFRVML